MYNLDIFCCVANFANMRSTRVFFICNSHLLEFINKLHLCMS